MVLLRCPNSDCGREYGGLEFTLEYDEGTDRLRFECVECGHEVGFDEIKRRIVDTDYPDYEGNIADRRDEIRECVECGRRVIFHENPHKAADWNDMVYCPCTPAGTTMVSIPETEPNESSLVDPDAMEWLTP